MEPSSGEPVSVFPKATTLFLDTGNVVNWDKLKRKTNLTPSDELKICIGESVTRWLGETDREKAQTSLSVRVVDESSNPIVDQRDTLKYTLKLFLSFPLSPAETKTAVEFVLTRLGLNYVEAERKGPHERSGPPRSLISSIRQTLRQLPKSGDHRISNGKV